MKFDPELVNQIARLLALGYDTNATELAESILRLVDERGRRLYSILVATPEPAQVSQDHGYKMGDVVRCGVEIRTVMVDTESTVQLDDDSVRSAIGIRGLVPLHRCPMTHQHVDYNDGSDLGCQVVYYLPNPPGTPGEPFLECSEKPWPVGTWIRVYEHDSFAYEIDDIEHNKIDGSPLLCPLYYSVKATGYVVAKEFEEAGPCFLQSVKAESVLEARPPEKATKCEKCGQYYLPT